MADTNAPPTETIVKGPKRGGGKSQDPFEGEFGKEELQRQIRSIYNLVARLFGTAIEFETKEFKDASDNLLEMVNRFPKLRLLLRLLGPIATIGDLFAKAQRIADAVRARRAGQYHPDNERNTHAVNAENNGHSAHATGRVLV